MRRNMLLALPLIALPMTGFAAPWVLDKSHTTVAFSIDHLGFSTVHGVFRNVDMEIDFDPENIAATKLTATIDASSIDTFWGPRDEHVRTADFLDVANHATITFTTTEVTQTSDTTADVTGDLTILGVTRPVTLKAVLNQLAPSPFDPSKQVAGMTVTGEIDRTEFGMDLYAPSVGAVLPVRIDFEMSPAQ